MLARGVLALRIGAAGFVVLLIRSASRRRDARSSGSNRHEDESIRASRRRRPLLCRVGVGCMRNARRLRRRARRRRRPAAPRGRQRRGRRRHRERRQPAPARPADTAPRRRHRPRTGSAAGSAAGSAPPARPPRRRAAAWYDELADASEGHRGRHFWMPKSVNKAADDSDLMFYRGARAVGLLLRRDRGRRHLLRHQVPPPPGSQGRAVAGAQRRARDHVDRDPDDHLRVPVLVRLALVHPRRHAAATRPSRSTCSRGAGTGSSRTRTASPTRTSTSRSTRRCAS